MRRANSEILKYALVGLVVTAISVAGMFAQQLESPNTPDEMPTRGDSCGDLFARIDNLMIAISQMPGARGVIVIYEDPATRNAGARREWQVKAHLRRRGQAASEVSVVRGPVRNVAMTQLWLIGPGEKQPTLLPANAEFSDQGRSGPYLFQTERKELAVLACDPPLDIKGFADVLRGLPGSKGNIVIGEPTLALFRKKETELLAELRKYGIAKPQVATVHKMVGRDLMEEFVELWVVPPNAKPPNAGRLVVVGDSEYKGPTPPKPPAPVKPIGSPPPPPPPPKNPGSNLSGGVLNGKALSLPKPSFPAEAREAEASGAVVVEVVVDEKGNVISAKAVSGHETLRAASEAAARQAKFSPTLVEGKPVKVSGHIVYNFVK